MKQQPMHKITLFLSFMVCALVMAFGIKTEVTATSLPSLFVGNNVINVNESGVTYGFAFTPPTTGRYCFSRIETDIESGYWNNPFGVYYELDPVGPVSPIYPQYYDDCYIYTLTGGHTYRVEIDNDDRTFSNILTIKKVPAISKISCNFKPVEIHEAASYEQYLDFYKEGNSFTVTYDDNSVKKFTCVPGEDDEYVFKNDDNPDEFFFAECYKEEGTVWTLGEGNEVVFEFMDCYDVRGKTRIPLITIVKSDAGTPPNTDQKPAPDLFPVSATFTAPATTKSAQPVGSAVTVANQTYTVQKGNKLTLNKAKNATKVTVPATVNVNGKKYAVTAVGANAFKKSKAKTIVIGANITKLYAKAFNGSRAKTLILKTKKLKKNSVKSCLKGSKVKTVKVSVGKKSVNKKYVTNYKKIFKAKNVGRKVTVK